MGDSLEQLAAVVDFEVSYGPLVAALRRSPCGKGGRPPFGPVLMFKILVPQARYSPDLGVAGREDQASLLAKLRTGGAEDQGKFRLMILGDRRPGAAPLPTASDFILLLEASLILEPSPMSGPRGRTAVTFASTAAHHLSLKSSIAN